MKEEQRRYQLFLCHKPSKFVYDHEIFSTDKGRRAIQEQALPHKSDQPFECGSTAKRRKSEEETEKEEEILESRESSWQEGKILRERQESSLGLQRHHRAALSYFYD